MIFDKKLFVNIAFLLGLNYSCAEKLLNYNGYTFEDSSRQFDIICSKAFKIGFSRQMTIDLIQKRNNELLKLIGNLNKVVETHYEKDLTNLVVKSNKYYLLAKKNQQVYLNDELKKKLNYTNNIGSLKELSLSRKISNFINLQGIKKIKFEGLDVYYLEVKKQIKNVEQRDILAMYNINNHNLSSNFSYVMIRKSPLEELSSDLAFVLEWLSKI